MSYTKQTWIDNSLGAPLSAARLNHIEDGIATASSGLPYVASGGDDVSALNAFLAAVTPLGIRQVRGAISVSDSIVIPAGVYADFSTATVTQTGTNKVTLLPAAGATIVGGSIIGKGSDWTAGAGIGGRAIGIKALAANISVRNTILTNHGGAGIYLSNADDFQASGVTIIGLGSGSIPANDSSQFGVYINTGSVRAKFSNMEISNVSIGFIASTTTDHLMLSNTRIHDIPGQHAVYLENGVGLLVSGLDVYNTNNHGVKLQLSNTLALDQQGATFANITVNNAGDCGLIIYNTDPALTYKSKGITVTNVLATNCGRGVYFGSWRTGTISNITVQNCAGDGITFLDCQDVRASNIIVETAGKCGIRFQSVANGSNARIKLSAVTIRNAAALNVASNLYGVFIDDGAGFGSDLTFENLSVTATNGFMVYGLFYGTGDQATFKLRSSNFSGDTGVSIRLLTGPIAVGEWSNVTRTGTVTNYPTALFTRIGSRGLAGWYSGAAAPTTGTWLRGDLVVNNAPSIGGTDAWVCTTAGTPGTWTTVPLGIVGPPVDVQIFTASGTWTQPVGVTSVSAIAISGGSGGGSGRRNAAGTVRCGGGGGGGGALSSRVLPASVCGSTETVTVGLGGAGGAAITVDSTDGNAGAGGGLSQFGNHVYARVTTGGGAGTVSTGTAGAGAAGAFPGGGGGAASTTGGVGVAASTTANAGSGGGSGGGITSADVPGAGGAGAVVSSQTRANSAGAAINTSATASTDSPANSAEPGNGGGGGGASIIGAAGAGANGALYGGGGGGGGASLNGNNSGAGGNGANGIVIVISS